MNGKSRRERRKYSPPELTYEQSSKLNRMQTSIIAKYTKARGAQSR